MSSGESLRWLFRPVSAIILNRTEKGGVLMRREEFQLPQFDYFQFGNVHCGSLGELRWRIEPQTKAEPPAMRAWKWKNGLCFEKREEPCQSEEFPLTPEGLDELAAWLGQ